MSEKKNNKIGGKIAIIVFRIISIIIIVICLIVLYMWHKNNVKNNDLMNELGNFANLDKIEENDDSNENSEMKLQVNFEELKSKNPDTVAWVKVNNTIKWSRMDICRL